MPNDSREPDPSGVTGAGRIDRDLDDEIEKRTHDPAARHPVVEGGVPDDAEAGGP